MSLMSSRTFFLRGFAIGTSLCACVASAQIPNVFQDDTPANADEVNENFEYLERELEAGQEVAHGWSTVEARSGESDPYDWTVPAKSEFAFNPFSDIAFSFRRTALGSYRVCIPGTPSPASTTALVSAYQSGPISVCLVSAWITPSICFDGNSGTDLRIRCYQVADGSPVNSLFTFTYHVGKP